MLNIDVYLAGLDEGPRFMLWTCVAVIAASVVMLYAEHLAGKYRQAWLDDVGWDAHHSGIAPCCVEYYAWGSALLKTFGVIALAYIAVPWLIFHVPEHYMRTDEGLKSGGMVMVSGFLVALLMWKPIVPYAADAHPPENATSHT